MGYPAFVSPLEVRPQVFANTPTVPLPMKLRVHILVNGFVGYRETRVIKRQSTGYLLRRISGLELGGNIRTYSIILESKNSSPMRAVGNRPFVGQTGCIYLVFGREVTSEFTGY
jgi:hypothetical protein